MTAVSTLLVELEARGCAGFGFSGYFKCLRQVGRFEKNPPFPLRRRSTNLWSSVRGTDTMTTYKQSRSICNKLFEAGEAGLSVKDLFVAEAVSVLPLVSPASDQDGIFSLDIILTESLVLAVSDGRVVFGKDGRYRLADDIRSAIKASRQQGVLCTNADSTVCAICNGGIHTPQLGLPDIAACCGKRSCASCIQAGLAFYKSAESGKTFCTTCREDASDKERLRKLKRNCRKKYPWALCVFGSGRFQDGEFVSGSAYESVRALRKAAAYHHPRALIVLAQHLLEGMGCSVDVAGALSCFQRCAVVDPSYEATAQDLLFSYAADSVQNGDIQIAVDICSQLAAAGDVKAQYFVAAYGMLLDHGGNDRDFMYRWLVMASMNNSDWAKLGPAEAALRLGKFPQARLFFRRYRLLDGSNVIESTMGTVDASTCVELLRQTFRDVRRNCGYCGISLDRKTRKVCKGCETVAFCSRDCQKMDWNGKDGHRDDCKDTMALSSDLP